MSVPGSVRVSFDVAGDAATVFDAFIDELATALRLRGLTLEPGSHGRVAQDGAEVGRVTAWLPGERVTIEWHPAPWETDRTTRVEMRVDAADGGTRLTIEQQGLEPVLGGAGELTGWFAHQVVAPFLAATAPRGFGDWITDRHARRPSGPESRATYRDPLYHYPGFRAILIELALTADDYLLEVACGGGALLKEALKSGCRAAAVDHSPDMVHTARELNRDAIAAGRLEILEASAESLPFDDGTFTCAVMTGVLGFLTDPVRVLDEMRRVLRAGGRIVVAGSDPELRGTPGAPEPAASRLHFYDDADLENLGRAAGFPHVRVVRYDLEQFAREAGVPEEHLPLFSGPNSRFLLAHTR